MQNDTRGGTLRNKQTSFVLTARLVLDFTSFCPPAQVPTLAPPDLAQAGAGAVV